MNNKLQVFDFIQIITGFVLGISTKVLGNIFTGDIETVLAVINVCSLLLFVQGIINSIEDRFGIKIIDFKSMKNKPVLYMDREKALR